MSAELQVIGLDEIMKKIEELGRKGAKIENEAITEGAKPILDDAVSTTAFKDQSGDGRKGLKISRPRKKGDVKYVLIGIDKGDISEIFYMKFKEFGSSHEPARPFLQPAYERNKAEALRIIKEIMRKGLGLK